MLVRECLLGAVGPIESGSEKLGRLWLIKPLLDTPVDRATTECLLRVLGTTLHSSLPRLSSEELFLGVSGIEFSAQSDIADNVLGGADDPDDSFMAGRELRRLLDAMVLVLNLILTSMYYVIVHLTISLLEVNAR